MQPPFSYVQLAFLGPEFLTWLYFHIEEVGGETTCAELTQVKHLEKESLKISVGKRISLRPLVDNDMRVSVSGPMLDDSGEIWQAIRAGSYIDSLSLDFVIKERVHSFTLSAADAALSNVKTRSIFEEKEKDEYVLDVENDEEKKESNLFGDEESVLIRMSNLDEIEALLDGLFSRFLTRRLAQAFVSEDVRVIRERVAQGLKEKLPTVKSTKDDMGASAESRHFLA